jgi:hypothetical protein
MFMNANISICNEQRTKSPAAVYSPFVCIT